MVFGFQKSYSKPRKFSVRAGAAAAAAGRQIVRSSRNPNWGDSVLGRYTSRNAKALTKSYLKSRSGGSGTNVMTKITRAHADPLGGTCSSFRLIRPRKKLGNVDKLTAIQPVVNCQGGRVTSLIGKQEGGILLAELTPADITSLFVNTFGAVPNKTSKCLLKSCVSETMFTNMENVPLNYTLYDIIPKRDGNTTIIDPIACFRNGFGDPSGGAAANYLVPGVDPYMNPRFNEYFKVVQRTEGTLLPGNVHTHRSYYEPNYIISDEVNTWTVDFIKNLTHYTMIIIHGTPENDSTTKTSVSLSAANIDFVTKQKWTTKALLFAYQGQTVTNNLPLAFAVAAEVMNEFTGVAQAENVA